MTDLLKIGDRIERYAQHESLGKLGRGLPDRPLGADLECLCARRRRRLSARLAGVVASMEVANADFRLRLKT